MKIREISALSLLAFALMGQGSFAKPADRALYNASDLATLKKQIKSGGNANACYSDAGTTVLMRITYAGIAPDTVAAMVKELAKAGAKVNAQSKYKKGFQGGTEPEGMTALMHACEAYYEGDDFIMGGGAHPQVVKALLDAGANPNLKNVNGSTALEYALFSGSTESVKLLIAAGAKLSEKPSEGGNYLMMLSAYPHPKRSIPMVAILTQAGLDVNARDDEGRTALHYACNQPDDPSDEALWENRTLYVASLLKAGAKPSITDKGGVSPLELAKKSLPYSQKLVELLQKAP